MKKAAFILSVCIMACFPSCREKTPEQVIDLVDARIYYPQKHGLKSLSADVQSDYIYTMFERVARGDKDLLERLEELDIRVKYYWKEAAGSRYVIEGFPPELYKLEMSVMQIFEGTEILVNPTLQKGKFFNFRPALTRGSDKILLVGINKDSSDPFLQYSLELDKNYKILSEKYHTSNYISISYPVYEEKEGELLLSKIKTYQEMENGKSYGSEVEVEYIKVEGIYLAGSIYYFFMEKPSEKPAVGPLKIVLTNHEVNKRIDPEVFKKPPPEALQSRPVTPRP